MNMKCCFLTGDMSNTGGTERMTAWLANALCRTRDVHILSLHMGAPSVFFPLDEKVICDVVPACPGKLGILKQIRCIRNYLKENRIDLVINVDVGMGFYGILAAKGTGTRVITWEHGNFYNNWGSRVFPYMRRYAAKKSDAMVVLTEKDRNNYLENIKRCAPVYAIANPAESHAFTYDPEAKIILSVGHLLPNKGYLRVVEMAKKLLPSRPDWKWAICGEGPQRKELEAAVADAGLQERLLLPGVQKNMTAWYRSAAMLVMTSDMEGLPMTLLEAKGWGLPLVAFDIMTGPSEIIDDGVNGYLVKPFDINDMSGKIAKLMDSNELRVSMSTQSVLGMERFSEKHILKEWERFL